MSIESVLERHFEGIASRVPEVGTARRAAFVPVIRSINEQKRTIEFVASTESVDRYGDIIRVKGWDLANYKKNPVFLWAHRSGDPPIGKCVTLAIESNPPALVQTIEFADAATYPFADSIYRLYKGGFLKSVSVGFRPTAPPAPIRDVDNQPTGGYEFNGQELMELSAVPLPANVDAVARMISDGTVTKADAARVFASTEPAGEAEAAELRSLLHQVMVEQFNLSLLRLEAAVALASIERGGKRDAGSDEITTIEGLLSARPSITSLDQLGKVLGGAA